jgi:hypothetical protein
LYLGREGFFVSRLKRKEGLSPKSPFVTKNEARKEKKNGTCKMDLPGLRPLLVKQWPNTKKVPPLPQEKGEEI